MALENIIKKIKSETDGEIDSLLSEAKSQAKTITDKARSDAKDLKVSLIEKAKTYASEEDRKVITLANLELRKNLLVEKQNIISGIFDDVNSEILGYDTKGYQVLMKSLLLKYVQTGNEEIFISKSASMHWTADFMDDVNSSINNGNLKIINREGNFSGGFILKEGNTELDCTLNTILRYAKERLETNIANIIFKNGNN